MIVLHAFPVFDLLQDHTRLLQSSTNYEVQILLYLIICFIHDVCPGILEMKRPWMIKRRQGGSTSMEMCLDILHKSLSSVLFLEVELSF